MNEVETVKQYEDRTMIVVNNIRLPGEEFTNSKVVEKVITTLLKRYQSKIPSPKDLRDLSMISFLEKTSRHWERTKEEALRTLSINDANPRKHKGKKGWIEKKDDRWRRCWQGRKPTMPSLEKDKSLVKIFNVEVVNNLSTWKRYARKKGEPLNRMCKLKQLREITFRRSRCLQPQVLHKKQSLKRLEDR
ncbi:golgin subfamily A member 3-like [Gossypium australe]|uniref:Golgin subfamily A member 3-like n=1 Tax=Gossypium australe TaxID=47621 RepID=A0A5B6W0C8_9ROSI|nr:golgin subfamily A member 3-like [Gossypium australe]